MLASRAPINRLVVMQLSYCLPWHDQRLNGITHSESPIQSMHRSTDQWRILVVVATPEV